MSTLIKEKIIMMNNKPYISTVGEMIEYLQQFDKEKPLRTQYIQTISSQIVDTKERLLLKDKFIKDRGDAYVIEPLYY